MISLFGILVIGLWFYFFENNSTTLPCLSGNMVAKTIHANFDYGIKNFKQMLESGCYFSVSSSKLIYGTIYSREKTTKILQKTFWILQSSQLARHVLEESLDFYNNNTMWILQDENMVEHVAQDVRDWKNMEIKKIYCDCDCVQRSSATNSKQMIRLIFGRLSCKIQVDELMYQVAFPEISNNEDYLLGKRSLIQYSPDAQKMLEKRLSEKRYSLSKTGNIEDWKIWYNYNQEGCPTLINRIKLVPYDFYSLCNQFVMLQCDVTKLQDLNLFPELNSSNIDDYHIQCPLFKEQVLKMALKTKDDVVFKDEGVHFKFTNCKHYLSHLKISQVNIRPYIKLYLGMKCDPKMLFKVVYPPITVENIDIYQEMMTSFPKIATNHFVQLMKNFKGGLGFDFIPVYESCDALFEHLKFSKLMILQMNLDLNCDWNNEILDYLFPDFSIFTLEEIQYSLLAFRNFKKVIDFAKKKYFPIEFEFKENVYFSAECKHKRFVETEFFKCKKLKI